MKKVMLALLVVGACWGAPLQAQNWFHASIAEVQKAAEQGNADAQAALGQRYETGEGVAEDHKQAVAWYRKAAKQGNAGAQYFLGLMYAKGQGMTQDDKQAVAWFRKAAEQGNAGAQMALGRMYVGGGGPQDYKQAVVWFRKAAEQGNGMAQTFLGAMYGAGQGVAQDDKLAYVWSSVAVSNGEAKGATNRDAIAKRLSPKALEEARALAVQYFEQYQPKQ